MYGEYRNGSSSQMHCIVGYSNLFNAFSLYAAYFLANAAGHLCTACIYNICILCTISIALCNNSINSVLGCNSKHSHRLFENRSVMFVQIVRVSQSFEPCDLTIKERSVQRTAWILHSKFWLL